MDTVEEVGDTVKGEERHRGRSRRTWSMGNKDTVKEVGGHGERGKKEKWGKGTEG